MIWPLRWRFDRALIERDADELIERHTAMNAYGEARQLASIQAGREAGAIGEARPAGHWDRVRRIVKEDRTRPSGQRHAAHRRRGPTMTVEAGG